MSRLERVELSKSAGIHIRRVKSGLVEIRAGSHIVVLVRQDGGAFHRDGDVRL